VDVFNFLCSLLLNASDMVITIDWNLDVNPFAYVYVQPKSSEQSELHRQPRNPAFPSTSA
jgi:hypothetical protein